MRRSNIRISTEVNVQQGCLCTLEHNGLSCLVCLIGQNGNVVHILCQTLAVFGILCNHCVQIKRLAAVAVAGNFVVLLCRRLIERHGNAVKMTAQQLCGRLAVD